MGEQKKTTFIAFLDDDNTKKEFWVDLLERDSQIITFMYNSERYVIPYHRILKIKKKGGESE